jgi:hypothetical protein
MDVMMDLIHTSDSSPSQSNQSLLNIIIEITNKSEPIPKLYFCR